MKRRTLLLPIAVVALAAATPAAWSQALGHLNVPWRQMVLSHFNPMSGTQSNIHQWLGVSYPDGTADPMLPDSLVRQTLVLQDVVLLVFRPNGPTTVAESGEVYLAEVDATQKARPVVGQTALVHYTMPANETRLVLRVSIAAGHAFSVYRHPAFVHSGPTGVQINVRANGYLLPN
jgi:hypothetical protein